MKAAYKKAFEESFVDDYEDWRSALHDANGSILAIGEKHPRKKLKLYQYDEFCRLAKGVIDERMDAMDWDRIIQDEVRLARHKKGKRDQLSARAKVQINKMESEVLFACFERAILERIGPRMYKMYKHEIEQLKKCKVVL